jgi:hypothetical protein
MGDESEAGEIEQRSVERIHHEGGGRRGQNPARRPARGFQHQRDQRRAERDVDSGGIRRAIDEGLEVEDGPCQGRDRRRDQQPVHNRHAGAIASSARVEQETENQRQQQKRDPVDLRLNNPDDPVERVARQPDGQHRPEHRGAPLQVTRRRLEREILDGEWTRGYCFHTPRSR